jgi:phage terminase Nu1 subunit (DNA packaging protein)
MPPKKKAAKKRTAKPSPAKKTPTPALSLKEFAALKGINERTVRLYLQAGMPAKKKAGLWTIDEAEATAWMQVNRRGEGPGRPSGDRAEDYKAAQLRKELALADVHELRAAKMRGELVSIEKVKSDQASRVRVVRKSLLAMPAALAPQLVGLDAAEIQETIHTQVISMLEDFAR